ncbi:MAG TPA: hypothetical protein VEG42_03405, partial [Thermoplasmata archaeon]|nr:hypothetical protein [Thermoplasmata archaeon]
GGVGGVIVGAGIYSTLLEPETVGGPTVRWEPGTAEPTGDATSVKLVASAVPSRTDAGPAWWEGPARGVANAESSTSGPSRISSPTRRPPTSRPAGASPAPSGPAPPVSKSPSRGRYSLQELRKTLDELESMAGASPGSSLRAARLSGAHTVSNCVDCDRAFPGGRASARCPGCGRGLCGSCVELSRSEDGVVRCTDCRARDSAASARAS